MHDLRHQTDLRSEPNNLSSTRGHLHVEDSSRLAARSSETHRTRVKDSLKEFVQVEPERAAIAAMAAGAVLTGLFRYLIVRKRSRNAARTNR